jgi:hypothetical protein
MADSDTTGQTCAQCGGQGWFSACDGAIPVVPCLRCEGTGRPDPTITAFGWRDDLVVDYVRRMPATIKNVASHFCMPLKEAHDLLVKLEDEGRIQPYGRHHWKISQ